MSVKSSRKQSDAAGQYIQLLDAQELDGDSNATLLMPVAIGAARKMSVTLSSPLRSVSTPDAAGDMATCPSGISSNKITVGDASVLWAFGRMIYNSYGTDDDVVVTPLILDGSNNVLTFLDPVVFVGLQPKSGDDSFFIADLGDAEIISRLFRWDAGVAEYIGFHLRFNATYVAQVYLYAGVTSGLRPDGNDVSAKPITSSASVWANSGSAGGGG